MTKRLEQAGLKLIKMVIVLYQKAFSPFFPPKCRYYPTCSHYALEAVEHFGIIRGGYLALIRILSCHPGFEGGVDFVPHQWPGWKEAILMKTRKASLVFWRKKGSG